MDENPQAQPAADVAGEGTQPVVSEAADVASPEMQTGDAAAPKAPASPKSLEEIIAHGTQEEIAAALNGDMPAESAGETEALAEPSGEQEEAGEEADDSDEAGEPETTPVTETAKASRNRIDIRAFDEASQATLNAARSYAKAHPGVSLAAALAAVDPSFAMADASAKTEPAKPAAPEKPAAPTLAEQIKTKQGEYQAALNAFDQDTAGRLHSEILDLVTENATSKAVEKVEQRTAQAQATATLQAGVQKHVDAIAAVVPDFLVEGTALAKARDAICDAMEKDNPKFFQDPKWPRKALAMAWADAHPDQPMPAIPTEAPAAKANGAKPAPKAAAVTPPRTPQRQGISPAMISPGRPGAPKPGTALAKVASGNYTQADVVRAFGEATA